MRKPLDAVQQIALLLSAISVPSAVQNHLTAEIAKHAKENQIMRKSLDAVQQIASLPSAISVPSAVQRIPNR